MQPRSNSSKLWHVQYHQPFFGPQVLLQVLCCHLLAIDMRPRFKRNSSLVLRSSYVFTTYWLISRWDYTCFSSESWDTFRQNQRGHGCFMDTETHYYLAVERGTPGFPRAFICRGNPVMMTPNLCEEKIQRDVKWWAWDGSGRLPEVELQRMYLQKLQHKGKWGFFLEKPDAWEQILMGVFQSEEYYFGELWFWLGSCLITKAIAWGKGLCDHQNIE